MEFALLIVELLLGYEARDNVTRELKEGNMDKLIEHEYY